MNTQRVFGESIRLVLGNQRIKTAEIFLDQYFQLFTWTHVTPPHVNGSADTYLIRGMPIHHLARWGLR